MINSYFDKEEIRVVQGGPQITQQLLKQKWDHIFFTGSEKVGRIVMETASQNLCPVTLELGGKSPCVVTHDCDLEKTARRIVFGKFINAGQTCIAPDYLLVDKKIKDQLIDRIKTHIQLFFGEHPENSKDYGNIINDFHFERLCRYLDEVKVLYGGQTNKESKFIAPTLVEEGSDKTLMSEEIFGPILPVICYKI